MNEMSFHFPPPPDRVYDHAEMLDFHKRHFQELAENHNNKWLNRIKTALGLSQEKDEVTIAREQAEIENDERERHESVEFKKWQESLQRVLDELQLVKNNPEEAERLGIKPLLLVMGGGMRGPYCAGQVAGLHDVGLGSVFKNVVGFSAGSGPAAYFVAGAEQCRNATSLFSEECSTSEFLDLKRFLQFKKIIDTGVIARNMRSGPKALDQEAVQNSPTGLYAGVTNTATGQVEFVDMKTATRNGEKDMVATCEASSAIPLFEDPFEVNGKMYQDGSVGELPFAKLIEQFSPTSILVLPNLSFSELDSQEATSVERIFLSAAQLLGKEGSLGAGPLESTGDNTGSLNTMEALRQTAGIKGNSKKALSAIKQMVFTSDQEKQKIKEEARKAITAIEDKTQVKIGVLWPPHGGLTNLGNRAGTTKSAIMAALADVHKQVGQEAPEEIWV